MSETTKRKNNFPKTLQLIESDFDGSYDGMDGECAIHKALVRAGINRPHVSGWGVVVDRYSLGFDGNILAYRVMGTKCLFDHTEYCLSGFSKIYPLLILESVTAELFDRIIEKQMTYRDGDSNALHDWPNE